MCRNSVLMYADDQVLLAQSEDEVQFRLNLTYYMNCVKHGSL